MFKTKVELFQHFLIIHQDKLLSGEEYNQDGNALQKEIEDLEKKVLNFTRDTFKVCMKYSWSIIILQELL